MFHIIEINVTNQGGLPVSWVTLSYSLPSGSTSGPRVAVWRRLRRLGAVSPTGGFYLLPASDEAAEAFTWLAQEIRAAGGRALVFGIERLEEGAEREIVASFQEIRDEEYKEVASEASALAKHARQSAVHQPELRERLEKLRKRYEEIQRIDHFKAPGAAAAAAALDRAAGELKGRTGQRPKISPADPAAYRGRIWVTRPRPHVDRLACAWLIRRFVDPESEIRYAEKPEPDEIAFDMREGPFGHRGSWCTFETLVAAFGLDDPALTILAEIVHEIDLRDGSSGRPEIPGIDRILSGWREGGLSDAELEAHGVMLFEGLYAAFSRSFPGGKASNIDKTAEVTS